MQIASASPAARERKKEEETRRAFRLARAFRDRASRASVKAVAEELMSGTQSGGLGVIYTSVNSGDTRNRELTFTETRFRERGLIWKLSARALHFPSFQMTIRE